MPVHRAQGEGREHREGEKGAESGDGVGLASAKGISRDIRVSKRDHGHPSAGESGKQPDSRPCRLLQVVDDYQAKPVDGCPCVAAVERRDRELHELGGVELGGAGAAHHAEVVGDEGRGGYPFRPVSLLPEQAEPLGSDTVLCRTTKEFAQFGSESAQPPHLRSELLRPGRARSVFEVSVDELGDVAVLVGTGGEPRRFDPGIPCGIAHDLEGERVDRACDRTVRRHPEPHGENIAQPSRRRAARGEHQQLLRSEATLLYPVSYELDQRRGLSRPRCPDNGGGRVIGEVEHRLLGCVELDATLARLPRRLAPKPRDRHRPNVARAGDTGQSWRDSLRPKRTQRFPLRQLS